MDTDHLAGEVDQDRGQSSSACEIRHFSDGRGGDPAELVCFDPGQDRPVAAVARDWLKMDDILKNGGISKSQGKDRLVVEKKW
jgi:hypothetical protein